MTGGPAIELLLHMMGRMMLLGAALGQGAAAAPPLPCSGPLAGAAWCQPGPPFAPRAAALVSNLTAQEKAQLILMIDV